MKVIIKHPHKCKCIAKAPGMGPGRSFWIGELTEPVPEHPEETHCLHLITNSKEIEFLCNIADFQQLQVICQSVTGKIDVEWIKSSIEIAQKLAQQRI